MLKNFKYGVLASGVVLAAAVQGCASLGHSGQTASLNSGQAVPAAQGEVVAKPTDNGNTELTVEVKHLAPPSRIADSASTYVVWAQDRPSGQVQNLGALKVDKDLDGKLQTVTPLKVFDVFITPETMPSAQAPTGDKVLWTQVAMD